MSTTPEAAAGQLGGRTIRRVVYTEDQIAERVNAMAAEMTAAFEPDDQILVVGLLKGSFIFLADLVRRIQRPLHLDFLVAASYGSGTVSSGDLKLLYSPDTSLRDRSVVIVEDIIDSGHTLQRLIPLLREREPRSLDVCTLLHKRLVTLEHDARWVGFDAPSEFLVGYGLDHAEDFRHLPYIASL
ncbi:MAG: hypoxanthine phosphoribosyltransferase [Longimicrobiales bacterium]